MPEAVDTPAPVSAVMRRAEPNNSRARACSVPGSLPRAVTPPRCHVAAATPNPGVGAVHARRPRGCDGGFASR
ncbi:hypothetical protein GCM10020366_31130 [Saccharopolyspora gregorii]|uniref:Uncharacterized protein n=1 Tax=Saccharopolyspora gregorii TaxID=33914 RepID=A0ABP6RPD2_9PSEU